MIYYELRQAQTKISGLLDWEKKKKTIKDRGELKAKISKETGRGCSRVQMMLTCSWPNL